MQIAKREEEQSHKILQLTVDIPPSHHDVKFPDRLFFCKDVSSIGFSIRPR
jgi:hypothetical protein